MSTYTLAGASKRVSFSKRPGGGYQAEVDGTLLFRTYADRRGVEQLMHGKGDGWAAGGSDGMPVRLMSWHQVVGTNYRFTKRSFKAWVIGHLVM